MVEKFDPDTTPVMYLAVSGSRDLRELTEIAEKRVKERLESLPGVGDVKIVGGREREVQVLVDAAQARGLRPHICATSPSRWRRRTSRCPAAASTRSDHEATLRTLGRVEHGARTSSSIIVATRGGTPIRIGDIGRVVDGVVEPRSLSRYNGRNGLTLLVRKQSGANTVATVDAVIEAPRARSARRCRRGSR